jgi:hypothetical protein
MENNELPLRKKNQDVSDEIISKIVDMLSALKMCKDISGLNDQQVCNELRIEPAQWSRIWSGQAHFPPNKIICLMKLCGNWVPLQWLAMHFGQELKPTKTTLERENDRLREELEHQRIEMEAVKKFFKEVRTA